MIFGIIFNREPPLLAGLFAGEIVETAGSIAMPRAGNIPFTTVIVNEDGVGDSATNRMIVEHSVRLIALVLQRD